MLSLTSEGLFIQSATIICTLNEIYILLSKDIAQQSSWPQSFSAQGLDMVLV